MDPAVARDLDKGWSWVVLVASFGSFVILGGTCHTAGLVYTTLLSRYGASITKTAAVGALFTALASLAGPVSSYIADRVSCRAAILVSAVLYCAGYLGTAFAPTIDVCILTCGIIAGFGIGIGYTTNFGVTGFFFRKRLNFAAAFSLVGSGVGIFAIAPAIELSREHYGDQGVFIMLAGISMQLFVFGMLMRPSRLELQTQKERKLKSKSAQTSTSLSLLTSYKDVCLDRPVFCLAWSMFLFTWGQYTIFLFLPAYCIANGTSDIQASFLLALCGIASTLSRLIVSFIGGFERVKDVYIYSGALAILAVASALFPFYSFSYIGQGAYSACLGFLFGCPYTVLMPMNKHYVGVGHMVAAIGIEYFFAGFGSTIGPIASGYYLDSGGSYGIVFLISGICVLLASILGVLSTLVKRKLDVEEEEKTVSVIYSPQKSVVAESDLAEKDAVHHRLLNGEAVA